MKKILVIEDEQAIREVVSDILFFEEFEVIEAVNGQDGVRLAIAECPDLIICDVIMPQLNGYEVLNQLQQDPITKNIPFIFLTAKDSKPDVRQGMNLGADDYLTKPFTTQELIEAVKSRFKKRSSFDEYYKKYQQAKQQLSYLLSYDPVTQCLNYLGLQKKFTQIVSSLNNSSNKLIFIISIHIDKFYQIKLTHGETTANLLLKNTVSELKQLLEGKGLLARIDGNEFAVVLFPLPTEAKIENFANLILEKVSNDYSFSGAKIDFRLNLGIAQYPQNGQFLEVLLQRARKALEHCKIIGSNYQFYHKNLEKKGTPAHLINPKDLRLAIELNQLQLHYQPQFNLATQTIDGTEALLYWEHPQLGKISPAKFIPLSEQTGLIKPITKWVLETACQQTKQWQKAGISPIQTAVNFSGSVLNQISEEELCLWFLQILGKNQLSPESISMEVTESVMVESNNSMSKKLERLKSLGISLSIDDFGTGYASFSYLYNFPIDILKIDKSFIDNIDRQSDKQKMILNNLITLAKNLNLSVTAEGVEHRNQLDYLQKLECNKIQGYLISPALHPLDLQNYIKTFNNSSSYCSILAKTKDQENFFISDFF